MATPSSLSTQIEARVSTMNQLLRGCYNQELAPCMTISPGTTAAKRKYCLLAGILCPPNRGVTWQVQAFDGVQLLLSHTNFAACLPVHCYQETLLANNIG